MARVETSFGLFFSFFVMDLLIGKESGIFAGQWDCLILCLKSVSYCSPRMIDELLSIPPSMLMRNVGRKTVLFRQLHRGYIMFSMCHCSTFDQFLNCRVMSINMANVRPRCHVFLAPESVHAP